MKVLLVGSDVFIAKALAQRFQIEEDQIYLLGEFEPAEVDEIPDRIKVFNTDLSEEGARDVFSVQLPEIVVYFENAQRDFTHDMVLDSVNEHIKRFMNVYALATWHDVNRFIYISTTDLYERGAVFPSEESPVHSDSLWESAHYLCEQHLLNIGNTARMFSVLLRTSVIYGPGQKPNNSEIVHLLEQITDRKSEVKRERTIDIEKDYLYIDDFCEAVYRTARSSIIGILNIGTGKKHTTTEIKKVINALATDSEATVDAVQSHSSIDMTLASTVLDYITHVDIVKGIRNILIQRQYSAGREREVTFRRRLRRFFTKLGQGVKRTNENVRLLPFAENLALFAVVAFFFLVKDVTLLLGFIDIRMLYILIVGAIFGLRQALVSTALCVGLLFYMSIENGYDVQALLYDSNIMAALFVFLLAGLIFGYISDRAKQREKELIRSEANTQKQLSHIKEMYLESLKVKDVLQGQIFNASNSYGRIFDMVSKLDSLDFNKLKGEIIRVTEEIMENRSISLYMFGRNRGFLRLMAKSQGLQMIAKSIDVPKSPELQSMLDNGEIYVRREIPEHGDIVMAAPVDYDGETIAVLMMHEAALDQLSLSYQNLFKITGNLVSQSIERAYRYQQAQEDEWYIENTNILKNEYFIEHIGQAQDLQEQGVSNFVLLEVKNSDNQEVFEKVPNMVREFDYVGLNKKGTMCILLNNTAKTEAGYVLNRLAAGGIEAKIIENVV